MGATAAALRAGVADLDQIRAVAAVPASEHFKSGVFQLIVDARGQLVAAVSDRCIDATRETLNVADPVIHQRTSRAVASMRLDNTLQHGLDSDESAAVVIVEEHEQVVALMALCYSADSVSFPSSE